MLLLALGLLVQGPVCAPGDLPIYAINLTMLLAPLFVMDAAARRIVPTGRAYVDLAYSDVLNRRLDHAA